MLPVRKIYVDTKFKTSNSKSNSEFHIQLFESIELPDGCVAYIDDITIAHSWYVIEENVNDKIYLYVREKTPDIDNTHAVYTIVTLPSKNYNGASLAEEIQAQLNLSTNGSLYTNIFQCSYDLNMNVLNIASVYNELEFKILNDDEIKNKMNNEWLGTSYDGNNGHSCNEVIGNIGDSKFHSLGESYLGMINLNTIRNLYLHSTALSGYSTIGPSNNRSSIIKKVPVSSNKGTVIFDNVLNNLDYMNVSKLILRNIDFKITDSFGNPINLHNINWSFSIIFSKINI